MQPGDELILERGDTACFSFGLVELRDRVPGCGRDLHQGVPFWYCLLRLVRSALPWCPLLDELRPGHRIADLPGPARPRPIVTGAQQRPLSQEMVNHHPSER